MTKFSEVWKQRVGLDSCFVPCDLAALDGEHLAAFRSSGFRGLCFTDYGVYGSWVTSLGFWNSRL